jgi:uncharacterized protein YfbU (UPF0304 family)
MKKEDSLSIIERQILANQFKILSKLSENEDDEYQSKNYLMKHDILVNGYTGEYHQVLEVHSEEISIEVCEETSQILNMYRRINYSIEKLTDEEKQNLELDKISFEGFDGNNDDHFGYMNFMIENLDKWQEYKGKYLNSHSIASIRKYRKMLETYKQFGLGIEDLTTANLQDLINVV